MAVIASASVRRPALAARPRAVARAGLLLALLVVLVPCVLAAPASASPRVLTFGTGKPSISDLRSQARAARAQIARLDSRLDAAVERYDMARARLDEVSADLTETRRLLDAARRRLDIAQDTLAARMKQMYKSDDLGTLDVVLGAGDFTEIGTQLSYYRLLGEADEQTVSDVQADAAAVDRLARELEQRRDKALDREMDLREQKADVEEQVAQRQALLDGLDKAIRKELERQQRAAAAEARRLAGAAGIDLDGMPATPVQRAVVRETMKYLGVPYVWGGASPSGGFDCSGLVLYVYAKFGVDFPHAATYQARMGDPVPLSRLQPADLVFFGTPSFYHHVGIYIGGGKFIEAPHTGDVVKISTLAGRGCSLACRYDIHFE